MKYTQREGKYGPIYQVAEGITVLRSPIGTWEVSIWYDGERKRKRFGDELDTALRYAELVAAKLGIASEAKREEPHSMGEAAAEWLRIGEGRWSPNTVERYSGIVRDFILPRFGRLPLERVGRREVKDFLAEVLSIRSAKTTELVHAVLSGIFAEAIDRGMTRENPTHGLLKKLLPPKRKRAESAPDPLSREDLEMVLDACRRILPEPLSLLIETLAHTGLRLGEALAMHADHLSGESYMVRETVRRGKFGPPKNGPRLIDLAPETAEALDARVRSLREESLRTGQAPGYLFQGLQQQAVRMALKRACRAAWVRVRTPHDLRHTYATLLLMDHMSPAYVQRQLGHHSITMTVDTYGHWMPGEGRRDLEKALKGKVQ